MDIEISTEFAKALITARASMQAIIKSKVNPAYRSKYADIKDVLEEVNDALLAQGIIMTMPLLNGEDELSNRVGVAIHLIYVSGESLHSFPFYVIPAKNDPQGYISATTYARRCLLVSYFGLPTEDDDGNKASGKLEPEVKKETVILDNPSQNISTNSINLLRKQYSRIGQPVPQDIGRWTVVQGLNKFNELKLLPTNEKKETEVVQDTH